VSTVVAVDAYCSASVKWALGGGTGGRGHIHFSFWAESP